MAKKGAPTELEVIRSFVNTGDVETGEDELSSPEALGAWLVHQGLLDAPVMPRRAEILRAADLREALRVLLLANNGVRRDFPAAVVLERAAARAQLRLRFAPDGSAVLEPGRGGVDGALGRLVVIVARAMESGTWSRLKACRAESCEWAFYDHTKNRSGVWCTMEVCGNRTKVRAYRARQAAGLP
jgi:predicted RNA-binding Zn ribbon-like protein